jgi:hypothetical protein
VRELAAALTEPGKPNCLNASGIQNTRAMGEALLSRELLFPAKNIAANLIHAFEKRKKLEIA